MCNVGYRHQTVFQRLNTVIVHYFSWSGLTATSHNLMKCFSSLSSSSFPLWENSVHQCALSELYFVTFSVFTYCTLQTCLTSVHSMDWDTVHETLHTCRQHSLCWSILVCCKPATVTGSMSCDSWVRAFMMHQLSSLIWLWSSQTLLRKHLEALLTTGADDEDGLMGADPEGRFQLAPQFCQVSWSPCVCHDTVCVCVCVWGGLTQSEQCWHSAETALTYHTLVFLFFVFFCSFVCCFFFKK